MGKTVTKPPRRSKIRLPALGSPPYIDELVDQHLNLIGHHLRAGNREGAVAGVQRFFMVLAELDEGLTPDSSVQELPLPRELIEMLERRHVRTVTDLLAGDIRRFKDLPLIGPTRLALLEKVVQQLRRAFKK